MKYFNETEVVKYDTKALLHWLIHNAGTGNTHYFFSKLAGNLDLQQIPHEYIHILELFRNRDIKTYLELGVGNGGSFLTNSIFIGSDCKKFHAVDSITYGAPLCQSKQRISDKVTILQTIMADSECTFFNSTTSDFFKTNTNTYDCIFIDADHTYSGVKSDYINSLKILNKNGILIFHDVGNYIDTGVAQFWDEIKSNASRFETYLWKPTTDDTYNCGIGIYYT